MCALSLAGYIAAALWVRPVYSTADFLRFFGVFCLLSSLWGITVWMARRDPPSIKVIIVFAVLFRLAMLPDSFSKAAIVTCDLGGVWLLWLLAKRLGEGNAAVMAYAWNPLVIKEFAGSGKIDAVWICLTLAGMYFNSSLGPALAALVKPAGLLLTPAFVKRGGWRALIAPVLALAALAAHYGVSIEAWAGHGTFNTAMFRLIPFERTAALAIVTAVLALIAVYRYRKDDGSQQALLDHAIWITGAFLLTTPTFAPSNLTWILPFAALRWSWFWLTLSGTIFLSYHASLEFSELKALVAIQYAIPLFGWICIRGLGAKPPSNDVASRHGTAT